MSAIKGDVRTQSTRAKVRIPRTELANPPGADAPRIWGDNVAWARGSGGNVGRPVNESFAMAELEALRQQYRKFAENECLGYSELYYRLALGVSGDEAILRFIGSSALPNPTCSSPLSSSSVGSTGCLPTWPSSRLS
jgi:hypothetical protein